tara:strand:- start:75 stop:1091 length:1017 start_codon:yes stop_codon:yes gene_type:complete
MSRDNKNKMELSSWHHRLHKKLVKKPYLLPKGTSLLLSISGGQDSMTLLKLLLDLKRIHLWELTIWHGDHRWHENSTKIALELKKWCEKQNLNFICDTANEKAAKTEANAREWRYENLLKYACMLSSQKTKTYCRVLTGHTGTDRAESLIMNLARGSDLLGLSTLREERVLGGNIKLIRPLLSFSRNETQTFCNELNLPIWIDPSNKNVQYSRNKIRHNILPILEEIYKGCTGRISDLAERLSYYEKNQTILLLLALEAIKKQSGLCRLKLINIPEATRRELIAKWLEPYKISGINSKILDELTYKISKGKPPGSIDLKKGWLIKWSRETIQVFNLNK